MAEFRFKSWRTQLDYCYRWILACILGCGIGVNLGAFAVAQIVDTRGARAVQGIISLLCIVPMLIGPWLIKRRLHPNIAPDYEPEAWQVQAWDSGRLKDRPDPREYQRMRRIREAVRVQARRRT